MYEDKIVIALGSSLGGRFGAPEAMIEAALDRLPAAGFKVLARSAPWRSASWPDPTRPDYINAVAVVETALGPAETLHRLHDLEAVFGRVRGDPDVARNAPRTLDLDLIAHGRTFSDAPGLLLPHPRAAERLFVMGPLAEIAPEWRHPVTGETAASLAARAGVGRDARPL